MSKPIYIFSIIVLFVAIFYLAKELYNYYFKEGLVNLGTLVEYPCGWECCGTYWETEEYNLDQLASKGHLGKLIDMMDDILTAKTGI